MHVLLSSSGIKGMSQSTEFHGHLNELVYLKITLVFERASSAATPRRMTDFFQPHFII
jgi:hypothetical protein